MKIYIYDIERCTAAAADCQPVPEHKIILSNIITINKLKTVLVYYSFLKKKE
jgi:hypothetical protein